MVVLCEVAIEVILVGRSSYHVLKAFVGVSQIGHVGQAVRAGGIPVGVGQVVYDIKTEVWHLPSAVVSFEIAVEVVSDVAFGVVDCVYPQKTLRVKWLAVSSRFAKSYVKRYCCWGRQVLRFVRHCMEAMLPLYWGVAPLAVLL